MFEKGALSYDEVLTFMESAPANIFFKDTECKYRFVTEMCRPCTRTKSGAMPHNKHI